MKVAPPFIPSKREKAKIEGTTNDSCNCRRRAGAQQLRVDEGHPLLAKAALDAVKQGQYEPLVVDGIPVEVKTSIYVVFPAQELRS